MIINPGSHQPQGPWDPNEKPKWIDTTYFWTLLPLLIFMLVAIGANVYFGR